MGTKELAHALASLEVVQQQQGLGKWWLDLLS